MSKFTESEQWATGKRGEAFLDDFFRKEGWNVQPTNAYQERILCLGDRIFSKVGERHFVEYKTDNSTIRTGNIFLETVSVDSTCVPGWVYTCQADYIFYAVLLNYKILIFVPGYLRQHIAALKAKFKETKTSHNQNDGYNTHGLIVPLEYAEQHLAQKIIQFRNSA